MFYTNWRFRLVFVCLVLLAATGYSSFGEIAYLFGGRSARATVTGVSEVTEHRRSSTTERLQVDYAFAEPNGTPRTGGDSQPLGWSPPAGGAIEVRYTPGEFGRSRIAGNVSVFPLLLFGGSLVALLVFGFLLLLEARQAAREPARRRRRRP